MLLDVKIYVKGFGFNVLIFKLEIFFFKSVVVYDGLKIFYELVINLNFFYFSGLYYMYIIEYVDYKLL